MTSAEAEKLLTDYLERNTKALVCGDDTTYINYSNATMWLKMLGDRLPACAIVDQHLAIMRQYPDIFSVDLILDLSDAVAILKQCTHQRVVAESIHLTVLSTNKIPSR